MALIVSWLLSVLVLPVFGQGLRSQGAERGTPPVPAFGIHDEAGLLARDPERMKEISARLTDLQNEHGFRLLFSLEPVLMSTTPTEWAATLQHAWLPEGGGLVVVYEVDTREVGFGRSFETDGELITEEIPSFALTDLLMRAMDGYTRQGSTPDIQLAWLVERLSDEFSRYFERKAQPPPVGQRLRVALIVLGVFAALGLVFLLIGVAIRKISPKPDNCRYFPCTQQPERLAAPCGGGVGATRDF